MAGRKNKRDPNKNYVKYSTFLVDESIDMLNVALATTHKKHGSKENLLSHIIVEYLSNPDKWSDTEKEEKD